MMFLLMLRFLHDFYLSSFYIWVFDILIETLRWQATRHARRVYVGGLPPSANEQVRSYVPFYYNLYFVFPDV